jgi:trehalose 2-sulfotransferase
MAASAPEDGLLHALSGAGVSTDDDGGHAARVYDLAADSADYPQWDGTPKRTIVLCTQQRSGSTLLGEALYFAGDMGCPLEYFHPGFRPAFEARWGVSGFEDYVAALHRFRTASSGVFATKLFWRDVLDLAHERSPGAFEALRMASPATVPLDSYQRLFGGIAEAVPSATWIFLTRRDAVRQAVSNYVAWKTDSWRLSGALKPGAVPAPAYDPDLIRRLLSRILRGNAHWCRFFQANGLAAIELSYEELERDYASTLRRVFAATGFPDAPVAPPRLRKQANAVSDALLARFTAEFG